jgi:AcrR family transcriptional regulator
VSTAPSQRPLKARAKPAKHAYHHGDLRRAILDVAIGILEKEGPEALTLREVARRLGVTSAAPYHHFADKDAILAAVAEEGFMKLVAATEIAHAGATKKPLARLRAQGIAYVTFAVKHPSHYRVMFGRLVDIQKYPSLHAAADRAFMLLLESIMEGQEAKVVRPGDPHEHALLAWSTVHGLATLWMDCGLKGPPGTPERSIEELAKAATDMLVRGLARSS